MANALFITNAMAIAMCNAIVDSIDTGGAGTLKIYGDTRPTDADTAVGAQTLLATLTFNATAFGAAADGTPGGVATANAIADDSSADATDTATWFRVLDGSSTAIMDGTVGTSDADLILNTTAITAGSTVSISSMTVTQPES